MRRVAPLLLGLAFLLTGCATTGPETADWFSKEDPCPPEGMKYKYSLIMKQVLYAADGPQEGMRLQGKVNRKCRDQYFFIGGPNDHTLDAPPRRSEYTPNYDLRPYAYEDCTYTIYEWTDEIEVRCY